MSKQTPFQQFQAPAPTKMPGRWFKRHIIIDHVNRCVFIQIMWDGTGDIKREEYARIKAGMWGDYVPKKRIPEYQAAIGSGYKIQPMVLVGAEDGEEHTCMQIIDLKANVALEHSDSPVAEA